MDEKEVGHLHTLRSKLRSFDARDDRGDLAVIMGIFVLMLLTMIPLAGYVGALAQQPIVLQDQKYQGALGAAESGVSDFMNRLNAALSYATASQVNPSGFVASPGGGYFYYTTSQLSNGSVAITSTGAVTGAYGTVERTIRVTATQANPFTKYMLFANHNSMSNGTQNNYTCQSSPCDVSSGLGSVNGPMMTNDQFYNQDARVSFPSGANSGSSASGYTTTGYPGGISHSTPLTLPSTLLGMEAASQGGCTYLGPTYIRFNSSGGYYVTSPDTAFTSSSGCYPPDGIVSNTSAGNGVIYVGSGGQNCQTSIPLTSPDGSTAASSGTQVTFSDTNSAAVYTGPCTNSDVIVQGTVAGNYSVAANDIYLSSNLCYQTGCGVPSSSNNSLGMVAQNSILLGASTPSSSSFSGVTYSFDPCLYGTTCHGSSTGNIPRYVSGALMAMTGSFDYAAQNSGNDGPLSFLGILATNYTGNTHFFETKNGASSSGKQTSFSYDPNLSSNPPPYFPAPVGNSAWATSQFVEIINPTNLPKVP